MNNNGWIKVSDRLPPLEETVLLFDDWESRDKTHYQEIRTGYLLEFSTRKSSEGIATTCEWRAEYSFNITHWMPLPKKPTEI